MSMQIIIKDEIKLKHVLRNISIVQSNRMKNRVHLGLKGIVKLTVVS